MHSTHLSQNFVHTIHMYLKYFYVCFYPFEEKTPETRADSKYGVNSMILHFNI